MMWKFSAYVYNQVTTDGNMLGHPIRVYDLVYLMYISLVHLTRW